MVDVCKEIKAFEEFRKIEDFNKFKVVVANAELNWEDIVKKYEDAELKKNIVASQFQALKDKINSLKPAFTFVFLNLFAIFVALTVVKLIPEYNRYITTVVSFALAFIIVDSILVIYQFVYFCKYSIAFNRYKKVLKDNHEILDDVFVKYVQYMYLTTRLDLKMYKNIYSDIYQVQEYLLYNDPETFENLKEAFNVLDLDFSKYLKTVIKEGRVE